MDSISFSMDNSNKILIISFSVAIMAYSFSDLDNKVWGNAKNVTSIKIFRDTVPAVTRNYVKIVSIWVKMAVLVSNNLAQIPITIFHTAIKIITVIIANNSEIFL